MWYVYIVRCADRTLYTGIAKNLPARIRAHNDGRAAKYTRARLPVALVYCEELVNRGAALRREIQIKRLRTAAKCALISSRDTPNSTQTGDAIAGSETRTRGSGPALT